MRRITLSWLPLVLAASLPLSAWSQEADNNFVASTSAELTSAATSAGDANAVADQGDTADTQGDMSGGMDGSHGQHRADYHNPAFVMYSHVHEAGQWMFGYRYSEAYMRGNQTGTDPISTTQTLNFLGPVPPGVPGVNAFMMAPTSMTMEMHMMPIMRGLTDDFTVYLMPTWMCNTMDMVNRAGMVLRSTDEGFSDLPFGALWRVFKGDDDELILNAGFSAPTGDIHNINPVGMGMPSPFPYTMRLGHGTWDARPGITYKYYWDRASIGIQSLIDVPLGMNDAHYQVGDEYRVTSWFAYLLNEQKSLAATFRVEGLWRKNYDGADPALNPFGMPGNDPNMRGGEFVNLGFGVLYQVPKNLGSLEAEYLLPVYQDLTGVQPTTVGAFAVRYVKTF